jgi:Icc-related predicted phosphoesterase
MGDFSLIKDFESWVYEESRRMRELLARELRPGDVVISHHLPSHRVVHPKYVGDPMNVIFVCDVEDLIVERRPRLWLHGHTHETLDVTLGDTRVVCNPFGYVGRELNPAFSERARLEW